MRDSELLAQSSAARCRCIFIPNRIGSVRDLTGFAVCTEDACDKPVHLLTVSQKPPAIPPIQFHFNQIHPAPPSAPQFPARPGGAGISGPRRSGHPAAGYRLPCRRGSHIHRPLSPGTALLPDIPSAFSANHRTLPFSPGWVCRELSSFAPDTCTISDFPAP